MENLCYDCHQPWQKGYICVESKARLRSVVMELDKQERMELITVAKIASDFIPS